MKNSVHVKYLFANEQDLKWGLTVNTVGYQHVGPGESYPPQNHPVRYLFSTERGRVLDEYQLLYLSRGRGTFVSANCRETEIGEGRMFMLFPGEWHSYRPDPRTGWDEYWIGFRGANIDSRTSNGFFARTKPVFNVGLHQEIVQLYRSAIKTADDRHTGYQQMLAGVVNHLLGYAWSYDRLSSFGESWAFLQINKARVIIAEELSNGISPEDIAGRLHMSYSWFRRVFKQYTGFSPGRYILELKIEKSKELLTNTDMPGREVAFMSGFENPDYFCTIFKKRTGMTPVLYRKFTQGKNLITGQ